MQGGAPPDHGDMADVAPPHAYSVRAVSAGAGVGRVDAKQSAIDFDRSWGETPSDALPGPAELLAAAFAACVIKNVERFSQMLPFVYESVEIDVTLHREDVPPRFDKIDYVVRLVCDEPPGRVELLSRNLAKFGTVYNTLAAACDVTGRIETVRPQPGRASNEATG